MNAAFSQSITRCRYTIHCYAGETSFDAESIIALQQHEVFKLERWLMARDAWSKSLLFCLLLWPWRWHTYELNPCPLKMYWETKNDLSMSELSKIVVLHTDRQTDRQTPRKHYHAASRVYGNKITQFQVLILYRISLKTITSDYSVFLPVCTGRQELLAMLSQAYIDLYSFEAWLTARSVFSLSASGSFIWQFKCLLHHPL